MFLYFMSASLCVRLFCKHRVSYVQKHFTTQANVTSRRSKHHSNFVQVILDSTYCYIYIDRSPADIRTSAHWQLIGSSMTLRYRPLVFFHNPQLIALSFIQGEIRCVCKICRFSFKRYVLQLRKSEIALREIA
jgi:hypothetical protein